MMLLHLLLDLEGIGTVPCKWQAGQITTGQGLILHVLYKLGHILVPGDRTTCACGSICIGWLGMSSVALTGGRTGLSRRRLLYVVDKHVLSFTRLMRRYAGHVVRRHPKPQTPDAFAKRQPFGKDPNGMSGQRTSAPQVVSSHSRIIKTWFSSQCIGQACRCFARWSTGRD